MNDAVRHTSVLIVGAGPSGLMMAAQLLRLGIQPMIIDAGDGPSNQSRAIAVHARSLEIYRQLGLAERAIKAGAIAERIVIHRGIKENAQADLIGIGDGQSLFPYVLMLDQSKNERLLLSYLTENACPVSWNTNLFELRQDHLSVQVKINKNGQEESWSAQWLIGADGAESTVRKKLNISLKGGAYKHQFYVADLKLNQDLGNAIRLFPEEDGFVACFPMKPEGLYRFIGVLPESLRNNQDIGFDEIRPYLTFSLDFPLQIEQCKWFATYKLHYRMAERFNVQRCFLIGDAAHLHSPVGGQGMNTGLQDAYNLAWKLAGVVQGVYNYTILNSYSEERMPVARRLLATTDRLFSVLVSSNWFIRKFRKHWLPKILSQLCENENTQHSIFKRLSQTGISYRNSSLSIHYSQIKRFKAGDRLPFMTLFDEKKEELSDLHTWCGNPGFTLLVIGNLRERDVFTLAKWIKLSYPRGLNFYFLPPSPRNQQIFDLFEVKAKGNKAIIVRPDLHIGYMNDVVDIAMIDMYLKKIVGWDNKSILSS